MTGALGGYTGLEMTTMSERRQAPRAALALPCVLRSRTSSPIWAETIDVSEGGMSVRAARPLRADETVDFDLAGTPEEHVQGRATVLRLHAPRVYGLRFERLPEPMRKRLADLVGA
jgi:c-di-GMP-binding flagellar brake protein YcgR